MSHVFFAIIIYLYLLAVVVYGKLKFLDDIEVFDIMDLNNLTPDRLIAIEKEADFKYYTHLGDMLNQCSTVRDYKASVDSEQAGGTSLLCYSCFHRRSHVTSLHRLHTAIIIIVIIDITNHDYWMMMMIMMNLTYLLQ